MKHKESFRNELSKSFQSMKKSSGENWKQKQYVEFLNDIKEEISSFLDDDNFILNIELGQISKYGTVFRLVLRIPHFNHQSEIVDIHVFRSDKSYVGVIGCEIIECKTKENMQDAVIRAIKCREFRHYMRSVRMFLKTIPEGDQFV